MFPYKNFQDPTLHLENFPCRHIHIIYDRKFKGIKMVKPTTERY
jgi:hypothetical protein